MKKFSEFSELQEAALKFKKAGWGYETPDERFRIGHNVSIDDDDIVSKDEKWHLYYDDDIVGYYRTKRDAVAAANNIAKEYGLL